MFVGEIVSDNVADINREFANEVPWLSSNYKIP